MIAAATSVPPNHVRGERRWPMAAAVVVVITLTALLPASVRPEPRWFLILMGLVLVALVLADPGRVNRSRTYVRVLSLLLLVLLALAAVVSTLLLVHELVTGKDLTRSATTLLLVGNAVWISNNVVFGLLYWQTDGGGPVERMKVPRVHPDLAFPQHMNPELAVPGWRPVFIDYLYLGFTNAIAFSPTDVMPLAHWAKVTMGVQSLISIAILTLVIASAVNAMP